MRNLYRPSAALRLIVSIFLLCVLAVMALGQEKSYTFDLHLPTLASTTAPVKKTASVPNWSASLAYDLKTKQFATVAQTGLKSFQVGPVMGRWTAFAGTELQNPWSTGSGGSVAGTGVEIDGTFRVKNVHAQLFWSVGGGQGFQAGSTGSHTLAWFGIGVAFQP